MQAGDLLLVGGEEFDRHARLLAQLPGPLDRRGRVGRAGDQVSFGLGGGSVDLCLLALAACLLPSYRFFLAAQALAATDQQDAGSLDGGQRTRLQVLDGRADLPAPPGEPLFSLVQLGFPLISSPFPLVGPLLSLVGPGFTFVGFALPLIGESFSLVGPELALIGRKLPGGQSLPLGTLSGSPRRVTGLSARHARAGHRVAVTDRLSTSLDRARLPPGPGRSAEVR